MLGSLSLLLLSASVTSAQQNTSAPQIAPVPHVTLAEVTRRLPDYMSNERAPTYLDAVENASIAARDAAVPALIPSMENADAKVRAFAILTTYLLYLPTEQKPGSPSSSSMPTQYLPAVAAHLRDSDPSVRKITVTALSPTAYSGVGYDALVKLVLPVLQDPDAFTEYPDPSFIESEKQFLATMSPEQQQAFRSRPRKVMTLPAEGPLVLGLLVAQEPSPAVDEAILSFLDRKDQTRSTIGECLHTLALSNGSERVNDEALRRVFELKAMSAFLLQFVSALRLTPTQLATQRDRLVALSLDETAHPALRRAAKTVAACWDGTRTRPCGPDDKDLSDQVDTR